MTNNNPVYILFGIVLIVGALALLVFPNRLENTVTLPTPTPTPTPVITAEIHGAQGSFASSHYYTAQGDNPGWELHNPNANASVSNNFLTMIPFYVPSSTTFDRIAIYISSAGDGGSVVRLGVYEDNGAGYPENLAFEAGTVAGDSTGFKNITISETLQQGHYWLAAVYQGLSATNPQWRAWEGRNWTPIVGGTSFTNLNGVSQNNVSGALPDPLSPLGLQYNFSAPNAFPALVMLRAQ